MQLDSKHAVCKVNPANINQTFAALTYIERSDAQEEQSEFSLDVLVTNSVSGEIIAHSYQPTAIISDAVEFEGIVLDTANYQLTPDLRAFGVRISYAGSSRIAKYADETLNLYVLTPPTLNQVIDKFHINRTVGDWDGNCLGDSSSISRSISMGKPGQKGYNALFVKEKVQNSHSQPLNDECKTTEAAPQITHWALNYNGTQYETPKDLSN